MFARKAVHYFGRALRETGQALDRVGLRVAEKEIFRDTFTRHRPTMVINDKVMNDGICRRLSFYIFESKC
jgi:hypothetical protein